MQFSNLLRFASYPNSQIRELSETPEMLKDQLEAEDLYWSLYLF